MLYFSASARFFDGFHARDDSGPAAALVTQPPLALLAWLHAYQPNKLAWGGARHGGKRRATPQAPLLSRWVRILSITTGSSTQAMILIAPPQARQVSTSMWNTRFRRCAQVIDARRSRGVFSGPSAHALG
jgi:hypothetical protein